MISEPPSPVSDQLTVSVVPVADVVTDGASGALARSSMLVLPASDVPAPLDAVTSMSYALPITPVAVQDVGGASPPDCEMLVQSRVTLGLSACLMVTPYSPIESPLVPVGVQLTVIV